jgi:predicted O-methyltransferase YrrM
VAVEYPSVIPAYLQQGSGGATSVILSKILRKLSARSDKEIETYLEASESKRMLVMPDNLGAFNSSSSLTYIIIPYYLVRLHKPRIVVETGVWSGKSSWSILQALNDNQDGKLFSVDIGVKVFGSNRLPVSEIGGFVPNALRDRWDLIIGDSKLELPKLLNAIGSIDMFQHDSDHSYEYMQFEYRTALKALHVGGIISSDDVNQNSAFDEITNLLSESHVIGERYGYGFVR